jgi:glycine/D-amino acid oxidase-like deaminating enzyme
MSDLAIRADIAVVGSGIVGAAVATRLARSGHRVAWCAEPEPPRGATNASGAMLGVLGEVTPDEDDADLALRIRAAAVHVGWREEFGLATGGVGTFVIASARRPRDQLTTSAMEAAALRHGLACERVEPADVPGLASAVGWSPARVLHLRDEAWVDAPQLVASLKREHGGGRRVVRIDDPVTAVEHRGNRVTGLRTASGRNVATDEVVLCVGVDVARLIAGSGLDAGLVPPVLPAKGVGLQLARPAHLDLHNHVLRTPNREFACGLHVVPRGADAVYVGATNRVSLRPDVLGTVTAGEVTLLLSQVLRELAAPLAAWDLLGTAWGFRALPVDGRPIAGRTAFSGLSVATGTYRNGVLLAPLLADVVAGEIAQPAPSHPHANPFTPTRRAPAKPEMLLRKGLVEIAAQFADQHDVEWSERLAPLLAVLGTAAFAESDVAIRLRRHARGLIAQHPRLEMVPEVLVELLQEDSADGDA